MTYFYLLALAAVVIGHFIFAYGQWFRWLDICKKLTDLTEDEAQKTISMGRSFASNKATIGLGICLSFLLPETQRQRTQGVVLDLVVLTGTKGTTILVRRLLPAAVALVFLFLK